MEILLRFLIRFWGSDPRVELAFSVRQTVCRVFWTLGVEPVVFVLSLLRMRSTFLIYGTFGLLCSSLFVLDLVYGGCLPRNPCSHTLRLAFLVTAPNYSRKFPCVRVASSTFPASIQMESMIFLLKSSSSLMKTLIRSICIHIVVSIRP